MDEYVVARGSHRGWSDLAGEMMAEEAEWIIRTGQYGWVSRQLLRPISVEALDRALEREFGK